MDIDFIIIQVAVMRKIAKTINANLFKKVVNGVKSLFAVNSLALA